MKIQKRFVALIVSVVLFALCAVVLTSCGECDHDYGEWVVTKEATCNTPGEAYRVCKLDSEHVDTKVIEPVAHTYGDYVSDGKVTCTTNGTKTATCTVCGYKNTVIDTATGHSFNEYTPAGNATCTTGAPETAVCDNENCDATDVRYVGEALGHNYGSDGVCSVCSDIMPNLARYDISAEGSNVIATIYETDKTIGSSTNIALLLKITGTGASIDFETEAPWADEYGKKIVYVEIDDNVTAIGSYSFAGLTKLEEVKLSSALTDIPAFAFSKCASVEELEIPASVVTISESAFVDCNGLETVTIGEGSAMTSIGANAFDGCKDLKEINLPDSIEAICAAAFNGCKKLAALNVTANLTVFGADAIKGTQIKLTTEKGAKYLAVGENLYAILVSIDKDTLVEGTLTINSSVTIIPEFILSGSTETVKAIELDGTNAVYSVSGNCIIKGNTVIMGIATSTIPEDAGITTIGKQAFYNCAGLASINIPANITTIESEAFYGAEDLKTVVMADSVTEIGLNAFADCKDLENLTLSAGLTTIGASVFSNCTALKTVTIPEGVTTIGEAAFFGCSKLETVTFASTVERIEASAFAKCGFKTLDLPNTIKYIGDGAFSGCSSVTAITLPVNAEYIGAGAFMGCSAVKSIEIPLTIGYIGNGAFSACSKLATVSLYFTGSDINGTDSSSFAWIFGGDYKTVPALKSVNVLGDGPIAAGAFKDCNVIESVSIFSDITKIGAEAFAGCSSLKKVNITDIAAWCEVEFADYYANPLYYANKLYINGALLTELVIPEGVTSIGFAAFNGCSAITSITLPSTLTTIDTAAFKGCSSLTKITLPESVSSISTLAFANCGALAEINIPGTITELAPYVFSGCKSLITITIPASITSISDTAFIGCQRLAEVVVAEENATYLSFCGIVYLKADKTIYFIPHSVAGEVVLLDGITEIKAGAFLNYPLIDALVIPTSVTKIGEAAFAGCTTLKSITLPFIGQSLDSTENNSFGYVFGTVPATLKTVTILAGTKIADGAFKDCESIATVNLPEGITTIGKEAFANCAGLSILTLPKSVTSVGDDAFLECKKLRTVYYGGTADDFAGVTVGINNNFLKTAKYYYFNDQPVDGGDGTNWYIDENGKIVIW